MTLRDYFAGQALAALACMPKDGNISDTAALYLAKRAYELSDAMLKERAK